MECLTHEECGWQCFKHFFFNCRSARKVNLSTLIYNGPLYPRILVRMGVVRLVVSQRPLPFTIVINGKLWSTCGRARQICLSTGHNRMVRQGRVTTWRHQSSTYESSNLSMPPQVNRHCCMLCFVK